jgi:hypothetical protein
MSVSRKPSVQSFFVKHPPDEFVFDTLHALADVATRHVLEPRKHQEMRRKLVPRLRAMRKPRTTVKRALRGMFSRRVAITVDYGDYINRVGNLPFPPQRVPG